MSQSQTGRVGCFRQWAAECIFGNASDSGCLQHGVREDTRSHYLRNDSERGGMARSEERGTPRGRAGRNQPELKLGSSRDQLPEYGLDLEVPKLSFSGLEFQEMPICTWANSA